MPIAFTKSVLNVYQRAVFFVVVVVGRSNEKESEWEINIINQSIIIIPITDDELYTLWHMVKTKNNNTHKIKRIHDSRVKGKREKKKHTHTHKLPNDK